MRLYGLVLGQCGLVVSSLLPASPALQFCPHSSPLFSLSLFLSFLFLSLPVVCVCVLSAACCLASCSHRTIELILNIARARSILDLKRACLWQGKVVKRNTCVHILLFTGL